MAHFPKQLAATGGNLVLGNGGLDYLPGREPAPGTQNEKGLYEAIGFQYGQDMNDSSTSGDRNAHANPSGARKMTYYLGNELVRKYGIYPKANWQWESGVPDCQRRGAVRE